MTLRETDNIDTAYPDNTSAIVGASGIPVKQDLDGTQIQRLGIAGSDADWGPDTEDLPDEGELKIAQPENVGGTRSSSGLVISQNDEPCSVVYVWKDPDSVFDSIQAAEDATTAVVERPDNLQNDTENELLAIETKSDNCEVWVVDESAQGVTNTVEYTLNFH